MHHKLEHDLSVIDGVLAFEGQPFNGLLLRFNDKSRPARLRVHRFESEALLIDRIDHVDDGKIGKPYIPMYLDSPVLPDVFYLTQDFPEGAEDSDWRISHDGSEWQTVTGIIIDPSNKMEIQLANSKPTAVAMIDVLSAEARCKGLSITTSENYGQLEQTYVWRQKGFPVVLINVLVNIEIGNETAKQK
jgi:hypothetical protein